MTRGVVHIFEDQDVQEAAWLMEIRRVRRLPVINANKRLVGILSLEDLSSGTRGQELTGEVLEHLSSGSGADSAIGWTYSRL